MNCTDCPLKGTTTPIKPVIVPNCDIMLISEAPGQAEEQQGTPFVGDAGTVLNRLLYKVGIKRGECSAVDIPETDKFDEPRIIGAVFKILPRCGYFKDRSRYLKLEKKRAHGREVPIWVLKDRWKAEYVLNKIKSSLINVEASGQYKLMY